MIVLLLLELFGGLASFGLSERTNSVLQVNLNDTMQLYNKSAELTYVWDSMQENVSNEKYFLNINIRNHHHISLLPDFFCSQLN